MVNGVYDKRPAIFKGNVNRDFANINYEDQKSVEYQEVDDDDKIHLVTAVANGDIV